MSDDSHLVRLALERGWLTRDQLASGRSLKELLSDVQLSELRSGRELASRVLAGGLLRARDLVDEPPEEFGRYRIVRKLGEGAAGQVYLARDPELGREVAVKILERAFAGNLDRFRREMEILASLKHPNIVTIHDAGEQDGRPYYAMEYVGDLCLSDAKLPLTESVETLEKVALACQAAHDMGVIHRDLKPANILMGDRPVVADFGIAKIEDMDLTETGHTLGTPYYMSPEQARGGALDARSDVYALGVMLYEAMTGLCPFTGTSVLEITRKIAEEEPAPPRSINPKLPRDLEVIALKAMAKEPGRRYATARAFAEDLRAWLEERPIRARPPTLFGRLLLLVRRKPRAALAYSTVVALVAVIVVLIVALRPIRQQRARLNRQQWAQQTIFEESMKIERWQANIYKPVRMISYDELKDAVAKIEEVLSQKGLGRNVRHQGFFALARAHIFMGQTDRAMRDLEEAIREGAGSRIGEYHFERARLLWERTLQEMFYGNKKKAGELIDRIGEDLRAGLAAGFGDDWYREFTETLLVVVERRDDGVEETLERIKNLGRDLEKPTEEVAKLMGDLFLLSDKPDVAIEQYGRAIGMRKCYVQAYNGLALAYAKKGTDPENLGRALEHTLEAIRINPRYEGSYFFFALLCRGVLRTSPKRLGDRSEVAVSFVKAALDKLREGSQFLSDSPVILTAHGTACILWGFLQARMDQDPEPIVIEGIDVLNRAIKLDETALEPRLALGIAHTLRVSYGMKKGDDLEKARRHLERAAEMDPENPDVFRWLGYQRYVGRDFEGALAAWDKALKLKPGLEGELRSAMEDAKKRRKERR